MSDNLPTSALLDSSVVIAAFGDRPSEYKDFAISFITEMLAEGRPVLIAAPTLAEINAGPSPTPLVKGIRIVAFDRQAAVVLAEKMPHELIKAERDTDGGPLKYFKYDAQIVACGLRWGAACLVSGDENQCKRSVRAGLKAHHPRDFAKKQTEFVLEGRPLLKSVP
jgi:predicted nucleic acid-binding protein